MGRNHQGIALIEVLVAAIVIVIIAVGLIQTLGVALLMNVAIEREFDEEVEKWNVAQEERSRKQRVVEKEAIRSFWRVPVKED